MSLSALSLGLGRLRQLPANQAFLFVFINVAVNMVVLLRSYATMRLLGYGDLGLVTLNQSITILVGLLHFGVFQGAYRMICSGETGRTVEVNNFVYTFLTGLSLLSLIAGAAVLIAMGQPSAPWLMLGLVTGVFTLFRTWSSNQLIALQDLRTVNLANGISAVGSMVMLGLAPWHPLLACVLSLAAHPLIFFAIVWLARPVIRPTRASASRKMASELLRVGFVVFLVGIFQQFNIQMERWYVAARLDLDTLGHLYLVYMFITLFTMVPTSLDSIFFPRLARQYEAGESAMLERTLRQYLGLAAVYSLGTVAIVLALARPVVTWLLPGYEADLTFVYIVLPGMALVVMSQPLALIFNVLIEYRGYMIAYGGSTIITGAVLLYACLPGFAFDAAQVMELRTATNIFIAFGIVVGYWMIAHARPQFRLFARKGAIDR